jgi:hypothetical protein
MYQPCTHDPVCPSASAADHDAARVVSRHPEQGWMLLCNGVVVFDDTGELLPDGRIPWRRTVPPAGCDARRLTLTRRSRPGAAGHLLLLG